MINAYNATSPLAKSASACGTARIHPYPFAIVAGLIVAALLALYPGKAAASAPSYSRAPKEASVALKLLNKERTDRGLRELVSEPTLVRLAQMKAADMAKNGYFGHLSPTYGKADIMLRNAAYAFKRSGENIAKGYMEGASVNSLVGSIHKALMKSSTHKENILKRNWKYVGIGSAYNSGGSLLMAFIFVEP